MAFPTRRAPEHTVASPGLNAEVNVTPFLDVLLVLLVIFMTMIAVHLSIHVQLPDPSAPPQSDAVPIVLEVGPRGEYAINRQPVPAAELADQLRALYADRPDKRLIVDGARTATWAEVLRAMDIAKGAGVLVIGADLRGTGSRERAEPRMARASDRR